jgi:hypothetical protein
MIYNYGILEACKLRSIRALANQINHFLFSVSIIVSVFPLLAGCATYAVQFL